MLEMLSGINDRNTFLFLSVAVTFVIPGKVVWTWDIDHVASRGIWPAGISVKCPVTVQAPWKKKKVKFDCCHHVIICFVKHFSNNLDIKFSTGQQLFKVKRNQSVFRVSLPNENLIKKLQDTFLFVCMEYFKFYLETTYEWTFSVPWGRGSSSIILAQSSLYCSHFR